MEKIDFKKTQKNLYAPSARAFTRLDVPRMSFLMVDGQGVPDPDTNAAYQEALEALYGAAYKLKFISKLTLERDYVVPPLEGLWWADDMTVFTTARDKNAWLWTLMIRTPDWITADHFAEALAQAGQLPGLDRLRHEDFEEGDAVQILYVGAYDNEGPTIQRMHHEFMPAQGLVARGKHHEIYLNDPRRTAPEKLKTVLRQPVRAG